MAGVAPGVEEANILVVVGMNESPTGAGHRGNRTSRTVQISVLMKLPSVHISLSWPVGGGPQPPLPRRILASVIAASSPPVGLAPPDEGRFGPPCILASRVEGGASGPVPHLSRASLRPVRGEHPRFGTVGEGEMYPLPAVHGFPYRPTIQQRAPDRN